MNRFNKTICYALLLTCGCGRQPTITPAPAVDTTRWSLTVDSFSQLDSQSALKISVDTPLRARVTFHEPHSQTSQSFIAPGGTTFDIRKSLERTDAPDTFILRTVVNGSGPSVFHLAGVSEPSLSTLHKPIVSGTVRSPFGKPVVIATHGADGQTTVTVDLEQSLDEHLVHADGSDVTDSK